MAADSATSLGYSNTSSSSAWSKSSLGASLTALALVEVVASAGTFKPFLVVEDERSVECQAFHQSINQSINQSIKQSNVCIPPFYHLLSQSIYQSFSFNQSVS